MFCSPFGTWNVATTFGGIVRTVVRDRRGEDRMITRMPCLLRRHLGESDVGCGRCLRGVAVLVLVVGRVRVERPGTDEASGVSADG